MATKLLFYNEVAPVSAERHASWHISGIKDYAFANKVNSVPLMTAEFLSASTDFPIVFAGDDEAVMPVLILGIRNFENVFVGSAGEWEGKYIPAYIRRYPFVFSRTSDEAEDFYLCIDESYPGFNQSGEGPALIGEDGKASEYTEGVLKFLGQFQSEFQRTQAFCKKLKELNLLERKRVKASLPNGEEMSMGFLTVDRPRIETLSSEAIVDLVRTGAYELIIHHLASLRNFNSLLERTSDAQLETAGAEL